MFPAKIEGNVVSTAKNEFLVGYKLLFVHPVDSSGKLIGKKDYIAL
jgi:microcompartment protein CcmK/EutM